MSDHNLAPHVHRIGIPDRFIEHGTVPELRHLIGMDAAAISKAIQEMK